MCMCPAAPEPAGRRSVLSLAWTTRKKTYSDSHAHTQPVKLSHKQLLCPRNISARHCKLSLTSCSCVRPRCRFFLGRCRAGEILIGEDVLSLVCRSFSTLASTVYRTSRPFTLQKVPSKYRWRQTRITAHLDSSLKTHRDIFFTI